MADSQQTKMATTPGRILSNLGPVPEQELDSKDTDPELFRGAAADEVTAPRCSFCGQSLTPQADTDFDSGVKHALRGLYWSLQKRMSKKDAAELTVWLQQELIRK